MKEMNLKTSLNYKVCNVCPRSCQVDRTQNRSGYCGVPDRLIAARASLHFWEEPCISGTRGSGTVFFSGCNLRCVYCQNYYIAENQTGREITLERLADIFLELQASGANNINLVTPSHYVPSIVWALKQAKERGLTIPIVYNCGGYESVEALMLLDGLVDIYLTDFKYMNSELAGKYSRARNYPEIAKAALAEMVRQCPELIFEEHAQTEGSAQETDSEMNQKTCLGEEEAEKDPYEEGQDHLLKKGVIVRHLLLPGAVKNAKEVIEYVYRTYGDQVAISVMSQYTPLAQVSDLIPLNRSVTRREYERLLDFCLNLGISNCFIQEGEVNKESFIPEFDCRGI